ncbi:IclR family transcriptional regulator domain-containing protein [Gordonia sp. (in: high G+C Gram-positive bacteria)]|uniref:IclR family transcriptional regulator domain-containing protein n=1 Tax=Gordonia sp. (in: high G+C Gram-positive bacteria) TaxID=84139 RepID=UPI003C70ED5E
MVETDRDYIQSIERGFAVLNVFDEGRPNPSLAEVAAATGLSRPAVRRILLTLRRLGYVSGEDGRWSLTPRVLSIGQHYASTNSLVDAATPHLLRVTEVTGESASLGVLDGADVVYAARVAVRRIMTINISVGTRVPAYATSMGHVLLAWAPTAVIEQVLSQTVFEPLTEDTLTDAAALSARLEQVREVGYATCVSELERGLVSIAAPVRDATNAVVGSVACSTSTGRSGPDEFFAQAAVAVCDAAAALSDDLGF